MFEILRLAMNITLTAAMFSPAGGTALWVTDAEIHNSNNIVIECQTQVQCDNLKIFYASEALRQENPHDRSIPVCALNRDFMLMCISLGNESVSFDKQFVNPVRM